MNRRNNLEINPKDIEKTNKRFFKKIIKTSTCWLWTKSKKVRYGSIGIDGKTIRAHRYSYFIHNKDMDFNMLVCHKCDNPICVNPEHLFLGTAKDNAQDMIKKGRKNNDGVTGEKHFKSKFTKKQVKAIRYNWVKSKYTKTFAELAKKYNVSLMTISLMLRNKTYIDKNYKTKQIKKRKLTRIQKFNLKYQTK